MPGPPPLRIVISAVRAPGRSSSSFGGRQQSAAPACSALRGMPSYLAVWGSWTKGKPSAALIALRPGAPSAPVPDKTTPMAEGPTSSASERNRQSTGKRRPSAEAGGVRSPNHALHDRQVAVRRDDEDVAGLQAHAVRRRHDREVRIAGEQLGRHARMFGSQLLHHDERHAFGREGLDELSQCLQPACGAPSPTTKNRRPWESGRSRHSPVTEP